MTQVKERRPTVRGLVKEALSRPTDENGEPVYGVEGYCGTENCKKRWHEELVSTIAKLDPVPTRLRCPSCGRYLSPRGHAPYRLSEHYPLTGEGRCPFHRGGAPLFRCVRPRSVDEYVRVRPAKKLKGPRTHRLRRGLKVPH
jgi:hypothetical protein